MLKSLKSRTAVIGGLTILALAVPSIALADHNTTSTGNPVPHQPSASGNSQTRHTATITRKGDNVTVEVRVTGAAPGLVHAQHIHGEGRNRCPKISRDLNGDGLIATKEGSADYGPVVVALTTSGDTTAASTLAVDRFPVADSSGSYTYTRTLRVGRDIPKSIAKEVDHFHIVVHGIDTNHNGEYDFSKGPSDLDPSLPEEATVPASCGLIIG